MEGEVIHWRVMLVIYRKISGGGGLVAYTAVY
jgi:hypothetical protein